MVMDQLVNQFRFGNKTALDNEGLFQLRLIQDFFAKKIPLSNIKVIGEYFDVDSNTKKEFKRNFPSI